jgi:hypothetical protein
MATAAREVDLARPAEQECCETLNLKYAQRGEDRSPQAALPVGDRPGDKERQEASYQQASFKQMIHVGHGLGQAFAAYQDPPSAIALP